MSYDYDLYCPAPFDAPPIQTTGPCLISLDGPDRVEAEDVPDHYRSETFGMQTVYRIHVQGVLNEKDEDWFDWWRAELIVRGNGVLIDLQTEDFVSGTTSGSLKLTRPRKRPLPSGCMEFVFENSEWFYETGFEEMLHCIERVLPAALPVRYGSYEPMQGKIADGGLSKLVAAFQDETDTFMKAKTPYSWIFMSIPCKRTFEGYHPEHSMRKEHLLSRVSFELRGRLFTDPKLVQQMMALFKALCTLLDVTYAQISEKEDSQISWHWYGLPRAPARTVCIGPRYQKVWPEFVQSAASIGTHHLIAGYDVTGDPPAKAPDDLVTRGSSGYREGPPSYHRCFHSIMGTFILASRVNGYV